MSSLPQVADPFGQLAQVTVDNGLKLLKYELMKAAGTELNAFQKLDREFAAGIAVFGGAVMISAAAAIAIESLLTPPPPPRRMNYVVHWNGRRY